jgi:hypothetical protein
MLKAAKTFLNGLDGTVRLFGVGANLALVSGFAWATNKLYGRATDAFQTIGPIPTLDIPSLTAWATDPTAVGKLVAMGSLWIYAIMAVGCGWMTVLGLRWCYHLVLSVIQNLKLQADKALA